MTPYNFPDDLHYHESHLWLRLCDVSESVAYVGITQFAQQQLGKILFVELPQVGTSITLGESFGAVESNKVVSELVAPVSGIVLEGNFHLMKSLHLINEDCYDGGWLLKVELDPAASVSSLMSSEHYASAVARKPQRR